MMASREIQPFWGDLLMQTLNWENYTCRMHAYTLVNMQCNSVTVWWTGLWFLLCLFIPQILAFTAISLTTYNQYNIVIFSYPAWGAMHSYVYSYLIKSFFGHSYIVQCSLVCYTFKNQLHVGLSLITYNNNFLRPWIFWDLEFFEALQHVLTKDGYCNTTKSGGHSVRV